MPSDKQQLHKAVDLGKQIVGSVQEMVSHAEKGGAASDFAAGKIMEVDGDYLSAIAYYQSALEGDPNLHEAKARLAVSQLKARLIVEGARTALELAQANPRFTFSSLLKRKPISVMSILGDALAAKGDEAAAAAAYQEALKFVPNDGHALTMNATPAAERLAANNPALLPAIRQLYTLANAFRQPA